MTLAARSITGARLFIAGASTAPSEFSRHDQDALLRFQTFDHLRAGLPINVGSG
jgi:hypothetical protein